MPAISLVVCVFKERGLLQRLLEETAGCFDDLVVVHDGPDTTDARAVAEAANGRFFERPRAYQQEPHWPFAWGQAAHDWVLRLDADEFPSRELKRWLEEFRKSAEPASTVSGYTCIWPLWDGKRQVTKRWPSGRGFLFHRQRVRFFGMVEQTPVADFGFEALEFILHHQPPRISYGIRNILFRRQAYEWRRVISESLMAKPTDLSCWRWTSPEWPVQWEQIRRRPVRTAFARLLKLPANQFVSMLRAREMPRPAACLNPGAHHFMLGLRTQLEKWRQPFDR